MAVVSSRVAVTDAVEINALGQITKQISTLQTPLGSSSYLHCLSVNRKSSAVSGRILHDTVSLHVSAQLNLVGRLW